MAAETLLLKAVDYALVFLRIREDRSEKERKLQRDFVEAFREALILTRAYIADKRDGRIKEDRNTEKDLSLAWNKVGLIGKDIEPMGDFYAVYFQKSDFWADPKGWKIDNPENVDISLERAEAEAEKFLTN